MPRHDRHVCRPAAEHNVRTPNVIIEYMAKQKKKLTLAQKAAKKERQKKYMTVFMNGKQVRVKRPETIDGIDVDEFIRRNADPIWLHQKEMWEYMDQTEEKVEFNWPWTMIPLELVGEWIEEVNKGLEVNDPIYGKDIFVSGRKDGDNLLLVDNDTDGTYAIVRFTKAITGLSLKCSTIEILKTSEEVAIKLKQDHVDAVNNSVNQG